jgi:hypothetical protein
MKSRRLTIPSNTSNWVGKRTTLSFKNSMLPFMLSKEVHILARQQIPVEMLIGSLSSVRLIDNDKRQIKESTQTVSSEDANN